MHIDWSNAQPGPGLAMPLSLYIVNIFLIRISRHDRVIIMSIHQARYSIFKLFDSVTLLSRGEIVYSGLARAVVPYFANVLGKQKIVLIPCSGNTVEPLLRVSVGMYVHLPGSER